MSGGVSGQRGSAVGAQRPRKGKKADRVVADVDNGPAEVLREARGDVDEDLAEEDEDQVYRPSTCEGREASATESAEPRELLAGKRAGPL